MTCAQMVCERGWCAYDICATRLLSTALCGAMAVGVLEKDISFGAEGTVFTNVASALMRAGCALPALDFIGGLGGEDISRAQVEEAFQMLIARAKARAGAADACPDPVVFLDADDARGGAA